jgi:HK97 family phage major capsid protein
MKLKDKLKARLTAIVGELNALNETISAEGYVANADDKTAWDKLMAESGQVKQQLARVEEIEALEAAAALDQPVTAAARRQGTVPGPQPATEFENFAEFMHAVRFTPNDQRLAASWHEWTPRAEQRMDTGSLGGFAIPQQFRSALMRVEPQGALVRPRATVLPAGTPPDAAITMPALDQTGANPGNVYGGVTVNKVAEGGQKPETSAKLREIKLEPQEFAAYMEATDKLLRNWPAATSLIETLFRQAMVASEDTEFLRGNGVGGPLGVMVSGAAYAVNRQVALQVGYEDITAMVARFLAQGGSPVWSISQSVMPQLLTMRNEVGSPAVGDGSLVWQPNARDAAGNQLLMGYPIFWNQRSPQVGTRGDVGLFDFSHYLIKDGSGPFVAASEHVKFTENKTVFKIFWNVDGQPC